MKNAVTKNKQVKEQINRLNTDEKFLINERRSDKKHFECQHKGRKRRETEKGKQPSSTHTRLLEQHSSEKAHGNDIIKWACPLLTVTLWKCIAIWKGEMSDIQNGTAVLRAFKLHDQENTGLCLCDQKQEYSHNVMCKIFQKPVYRPNQLA